MRLDQLITARGLVETRSKARDLIVRGCVTVDGTAQTKPGLDVAQSAAVVLDTSQDQYVSRGGLKLASALDHYGFSPKARTAIDIGASTGGFTDVLLRGGAQHVYAVDVGRHQFHATLARDARVTVMEEKDARTLAPRDIPEPVTALVCDVSFISLTKVLPAAMALTAPGAWLVALVKPQFELNRADIGKGGIVKSPAARERAICNVSDWLARQEDWTPHPVMSSPITGKGGNIEYLIAAVRQEAAPNDGSPDGGAGHRD